MDDIPANVPGNIDNLFGPEPDPAPSPATPGPAGDAQPGLVPVGPEPNVDPAPAQSQPAPVAAPAPAPVPAPEPQRTVPLPELLETRHRYQAERARAEELARVNAQLLEAMRHQQHQQPQPQQQQQPIDPVAEPERYFAALQQSLDQRLHAIEQARQADLQAMQVHMEDQRLNASERMARTAHGNEVVDAALEIVRTNPAIAQVFRQQPDPYSALVEWHRAQTVAREIGPDPAAYRARIEQQAREAERAKVLAELRQGRQPSNIPPSIAAAANSGSSPETVVGTRDFFNQMFAPSKPS